MIRTNLVGCVLKCYINTHGKLFTGSRKEYIRRAFTIHAHGGHHAYVTKNICRNSRFLNLNSLCRDVPFPDLYSLHMKFEFNWLSGL